MSNHPYLTGALGLALALGGPLAGCGLFAPKTEAAFLKKGQDRVAAKDYARALLEFRNASRLAPQDAEPYYEIGLTQLHIGDYRAAVTAFQRCVELNPRHAGAQLKLAQMMSTSSQKELLLKAAGQLRELLKSSPENVDANDALALAEWRLGNRQEAIQRLEKLLNGLPSSLSSSVLLAKMKLGQNDLKAAEDVLRKAAESASQSSDAALALAEMYLVTGQNSQAEPQIRRAIQLNPKNAEALLALASVQTAARNWDGAEQTYRQLSALPDKSFRPVHALFLFQRGKREEAIAELRDLVRADSSDRLTRTRLIAAYLETGKVPEARKLLADALSANPKDSEALLQRAALELRAGNAGNAQKDLQQVVQYHPESAEAHRAMARTHKALGQPQSERQELLAAVKLRPDLLAARLALARNYLAASDPKAALDIADKAPAAQKQLLPLILERNWALLVAGDLNGLRTSLNEALAAGRYPGLVLQEALLRLASSDYAGARDSAEEVLRSDPEDVRALRIVAETYTAQKQPAKALQRLADAAKQHPRPARLHQLLGSWQFAAGDVIGAREQFAAALRADADFTAADIALAEIDAQENRIDAARTRLKALVARKPSDVDALLLLAEIEQHAGNSAAAIDRYRAALNIDSQNLLALNNISNELAATNIDEALSFAQKALEIAPQNAAVQDTLGWIYFRKGIYGAATEYLKIAVAAEPNPRRQLHLALCYMKSGQHRLGHELLQSALRQDPSLSATASDWTR
jgi:Tfp pilus assembly protein PilF